MGQVAAVIVDEPTPAGPHILALGTRLFLTDAFLAEIKTPPFQWIGAEIVHRVLSGGSPALSDKQLREANTRTGLNLFAWDAAISAEMLDAQLHSGDRLLDPHGHYVNPRRCRRSTISCKRRTTSASPASSRSSTTAPGSVLCSTTLHRVFIFTPAGSDFSCLLSAAS